MRAITHPLPRATRSSCPKDKVPHYLFPRLPPRKTPVIQRCHRKPSVSWSIYHTSLQGALLLAFFFSEPTLSIASTLAGLTCLFISSKIFIKQIPKAVTGSCFSRAPQGTMPRDCFVYVNSSGPRRRLWGGCQVSWHGNPQEHMKNS